MNMVRFLLCWFTVMGFSGDLQMSHPWMYNDRRSKGYMEGVQSFLKVAEDNKGPNGFMCCPCNKCRNEKD